MKFGEWNEWEAEIGNRQELMSGGWIEENA